MTTLDIPDVNIKKEPSVPEGFPAQATIKARILEGFDIAKTYIAQLEDQDHAKLVHDKLTHSKVRGSRLRGISSLDDVATLLDSITDWREVETLKDGITTFQGTLPEKYCHGAFAAYATLREIDAVYGATGLDMVKLKKGTQVVDEYYAAFPLDMPTDVLTVQLAMTEGLDIEYLKQWFAGRDTSSIIVSDLGDSIVRCSAVRKKKR